MSSRKKQCYRSDTPMPENSAWRHFITGEPYEESWYHKLGLDKIAFYYIVSKCEDLWENTPLHMNYGKPKQSHLAQRQLDCRGTVGLVLRWMTSTMERSDLGIELDWWSLSLTSTFSLEFRSCLRP